jgi:hypothetical protein
MLPLLGWVIWSVGPARLLAAFSAGPFIGLLLFAAVWNLFLLTADAWATAFVYHKTICPVSFRELFVLRGASYLPSLLNHHVGQAWLTYFLSRVYSAQLWRVAGATLVVYTTTFGCLVAFGLVALPLNPERVAFMAPLVLGFVGLGLFFLLVLRVRPRFLAQRPLLRPVFELGVAGHLLALLHRVPHVLVLFVGTWVPLYAFGVALPPAAAVALIPPVMFVAALPITPQGIGTRDALSVYLFAEFVPREAGTDAAAIVAASTLTWAVALTLVQLVGSPLLMQRAYRLLGPLGSRPR